MTRENYDPDLDGAGEQPSNISPDEEGFELMPPDVLRAVVENVEDVERDVAPEQPGRSEAERDKSTDPDEWDH